MTQPDLRTTGPFSAPGLNTGSGRPLISAGGGGGRGKVTVLYTWLVNVQYPHSVQVVGQPVQYIDRLFTIREPSAAHAIIRTLYEMRVLGYAEDEVEIYLITRKDKI